MFEESSKRRRIVTRRNPRSAVGQLDRLRHGIVGLEWYLVNDDCTLELEDRWRLVSRDGNTIATGASLQSLISHLADLLEADELDC